MIPLFPLVHLLRQLCCPCLQPTGTVYTLGGLVGPPISSPKTGVGRRVTPELLRVSTSRDVLVNSTRRGWRLRILTTFPSTPSLISSFFFKSEQRKTCFSPKTTKTTKKDRVWFPLFRQVLKIQFNNESLTVSSFILCLFSRTCVCMGSVYIKFNV